MSEEFDKEGQEDILKSNDLEATGTKQKQEQYDTVLKTSHIQISPEEQQLDKLEGRIRQIQQRLEEIYLQARRTGRNFARARQLQAEKRDLKKELIDIAHDHKAIIIDQQETQYEKIKEQEEQKIRKLEQEVAKLRESKKQEALQKQKQLEQKAAAAQSEQLTQEQADVRRKERIIELESELNADNLRNSRRALIDYELASLRLSYYPYRPYSNLYSSRYSYISPYSYYI